MMCVHTSYSLYMQGSFKSAGLQATPALHELERTFITLQFQLSEDCIFTTLRHFRLYPTSLQHLSISLFFFFYLPFVNHVCAYLFGSLNLIYKKCIQLINLNFILWKNLTYKINNSPLFYTL